MQRVFLGTGLIGAALAEAACRRGDDVVVWNRTREKAEALEAFGATVATSTEEAVAGATRVHLALTSDDRHVQGIEAAPHAVGLEGPVTEVLLTMWDEHSGPTDFHAVEMAPSGADR